MIVKLFTKDGGFVAEEVVPPFNIAPEVIVWGQRTFIAPDVDYLVRLAEVEAGEIAYVEAFAYYILPGQGQ